MSKDDQLKNLIARCQALTDLSNKLGEIHEETKQSHRRQVQRLAMDLESARHQLAEYERCNKDAVGLANIREIRQEQAEERRRHEAFAESLMNLLFTEDGKRLRRASKVMLRQFHEKLLTWEWQEKAKKQGIV